MSELAVRIQESYERLQIGSTVYLLKNELVDYGELPDPDNVTQVFKADVALIDPAYMRGVSLVAWNGLTKQAEPDEAGPMFPVSPREVFKLAELNAILRDRTSLPTPKRSKLDRYIGSVSGKFGATLAAEMARVVLERFSEDPRDSSGNLIKR